MAGQLKVGGNIIASHSGVEGAGEVTLQNVTLGDSAVPSHSMNFRNKIINGDMRIDQRNAGGSVTFNDETFPVDRFRGNCTQSSKLNAQKSTNAPLGFTNSLLITSSSSYSVADGDVFQLSQFIEGFNVGDLGWGTANAKTITVSFWVRSSLTGTFGGALKNSTGGDRSYPFVYTISLADNWEYKTVTIPGDTSGTWLTDNSLGIRLSFSLGAGLTYSGTAGAWAGANYWSATGATSIVGTSGATFYITGVQLEVGTVATPFEHRPYGTELGLCQRYYEVMVMPGRGIHGHYSPNGGIGDAAAFHGFFTPFKQTKRITPIIPSVSSNSAWAILSYSNYSAQTTHTFRAQAISTEGFSPVANRVAGNSGPSLGSVYSWQTTVTYHIDAEIY